MTRFLQIAFFTLLTACQTTATAQGTLCANDEQIVFSCHLGKKTVSLCRPAGPEKTLVYRYGTSAKLELVYPDVARHEKGAFTQSTKPVFGGGVTSVIFQRGNYEYRVYSKLGRSSGASQDDRYPEFEDGVVIMQAGKELKKLVCDDSGEGFREGVEWLSEK